MSQRPLSDRQHHLPDPNNTYEVRVWEHSAAGDAHWRTLACCARRDDAETIATALITGTGTFEFAEIWGPTSEEPRSRRHVLARLPEPTRDEIRDMWRRAADQNYSTAYTDLNR